MNHHELAVKYGDKILMIDSSQLINKPSETSSFTPMRSTLINNYYDEKDSIIFGALRCTRIMFVLSIQYHSGRKDGFYAI